MGQKLGKCKLQPAAEAFANRKQCDIDVSLFTLLCFMHLLSASNLRNLRDKPHKLVGCVFFVLSSIIAHDIALAH